MAVLVVVGIPCALIAGGIVVLAWLTWGQEEHRGAVWSTRHRLEQLTMAHRGKTPDGERECPEGLQWTSGEPIDPSDLGLPVPFLDGWGHEIELSEVEGSLAARSPGANGKFEGNHYRSRLFHSWEDWRDQVFWAGCPVYAPRFPDLYF